jgi:hypothetical protein
MRLIPAIPATTTRIVIRLASMPTTPAATTELDGPAGFMVQLYIISPDATVEQPRGQFAVLFAERSVLDGSRMGRRFELALHTRQPKKENPPNADRKHCNHQGNGEQLLE